MWSPQGVFNAWTKLRMVAVAIKQIRQYGATPDEVIVNDLKLFLRIF
jgi:hypothetical protein